MLPKIAHKTERFVLPYSKQEIVVRPFTVGEEKIVLMAKQEMDNQQGKEHVVLLRAFADIMDACVESPADFDSRKLYVGDAEALALFLRGISVGGDVPVAATCGSCGKENNINYPLSSVKFEGDASPRVLTVPTTNGDVNIHLHPPLLEDILWFLDADVDEMGYWLWACLDRVELPGVREEKKSEIELNGWLEWIGELDVENAQKAKGFLDEWKKVECPLEYTCAHCGEKNTAQVCEDVSGFFI